MKQDKKPRVVAIIPSRYGSTRFPGKSLAMISGKSLIQRTYENAKRCKLIDEWIVATDDQRIFAHVKSFGGNVIMTPDAPTGTDRLAYVVREYPYLKEVEIIINIQGDEPCVDPESISSVITILQNDHSAVMSTAIYPLKSFEEACNPNYVKCVIDLHQNALYFSRSVIPGGLPTKQQEQITYYKHLGIYAFRPHFLLKYAELPMTPLQSIEDLEQLKVLENGYKIKAAIIKSINIDVNAPEDIKKVEEELCKQNLFSSQVESAHP